MFSPAAPGRFNVINHEKIQSVATGLTAELGGGHELSLNYFFARSDTLSVIQADRINLQIPTSSPYYPGNGIVPTVPFLDDTMPVTLANADAAFLGNRVNNVINKASRITANLEGNVLGFDYQLYGLRSHQFTDYRQHGWNSSVLDGLSGVNGAPYINPFGPQSPEGQAFIDGNEVYDTTRTAEGALWDAGLTLQRDLFSLPAGAVKSAFAFEYSHETINFEQLPLASMLFNVTPVANASSEGQRDVYSVTGEVVIPVMDNLEIDASGRFDHYGDAGGTANPKVQVTYDVTPNINLHASFNKGFRAPTLYQTTRPDGFGFTTQNAANFDPVLCPNGAPDGGAGASFNFDCAGQYATLTGANPDLEPEKSRAYAAGVRIKIPDDVSQFGSIILSADFWDYHVDNVIATIPTNAIFANLDKPEFADFIIRCNETDPSLYPQTFGCGLSGAPANRIAFVEAFEQNLGVVNTNGIDVSLLWSAETDVGRFSINYHGAITTKYEAQQYAGSPFVSSLGKHTNGAFFGFPVFNYQHFLSFMYDRDQFHLQMQQRYKKRL